jgi:hypothetical protein
MKGDALPNTRIGSCRLSLNETLNETLNDTLRGDHESVGTQSVGGKAIFQKSGAAEVNSRAM